MIDWSSSNKFPTISIVKPLKSNVGLNLKALYSAKYVKLAKAVYIYTSFFTVLYPNKIIEFIHELELLGIY